MLKEKMIKMLNEARAEEKQLRAAVVDGDTKEARATAQEALDAIIEKINDINAIIAEMDKPVPAGEEGASEGNRSSLKAVTEKRTAGAISTKADDKDMNYRVAFANYVTRGRKIPAELRADANTTTSTAATAIPENLVNQIITTLESYGNVLPLLTHTSYAVGQTIPTDGVKPTASWVAEGASSDTQNKTTGSISFSAFKLRCEISMSMEVTVQTLPAFEALFIKQITEGMSKAIELKVVSADDGSDCPTGILYRSNGTDSTINIAKLTTGHFDYKCLCDAEAELPTAYEGGAKWCMSKKTFMNIYSQTDSSGQPIGRINYGIGGKPERVLLGRDVVITPCMPDYSESSADADVCVAFLFDFSDYTLNKSYDLGIKSKEDWDTEDKRVKGVMSVDGKVIDRTSIVKIVKKYN